MSTRLSLGLVFSVIMLVVVGCGRRTVVTNSSEHAQRFTGNWWITSSGYPLAVSLSGDGSLHELPSNCDYVGALFCSKQVWFGEKAGPARDPIGCQFANRWHSEGDTTLVIESQCDDGLSRDLVFSFPNDAAGNSVQRGAEVSLAQIGEYVLPDEGYTARQFGNWRFYKCPTTEECSLW
jgi:hypothetical protein